MSPNPFPKLVHVVNWVRRYFQRRRALRLVPWSSCVWSPQQFQDKQVRIALGEAIRWQIQSTHAIAMANYKLYEQAIANGMKNARFNEARFRREIAEQRRIFDALMCGERP